MKVGEFLSHLEKYDKENEIRFETFSHETNDYEETEIEEIVENLKQKTLVVRL